MHYAIALPLWLAFTSIGLVDAPLCNVLFFFNMVPLLLWMGKKTNRGIVQLFIGSFLLATLIYYGFAGYSIAFALGLITVVACVLTAYFSTISIIFRKYEYTHPLVLAVVASMIWVCVEYGLLLLKIPFVLALSQHQFLSFIQSANLLGIHFVSFLLMFSNMLLFFAITTQIRKTRVHLLVVFCAVFLCNLGYGWYSLHQKPYISKGTIRIGIVQPNIRPEVYLRLFDNKNYSEVKQKLFGLLTQAGNQHPDIIAWPEVGLDTYLFRNEQERLNLSRCVNKLQSALILGSPDILPNGKTTNSVFYLNKSGELVGKYDKIQRVPFVEGQFVSQSRSSIVHFASTTVSSLVCFESIFSHRARVNARQGSDVGFVLSNDVYFDHSLVMWLHYYFSVFRAIETGRPVIRVANSGISSIIDHRGTILCRFPAAVSDAAVVTLRCDQRNTLFLFVGNIFPLVCFVTVLFLWWIETRSIVIPRRSVSRRAIDARKNEKTFYVKNFRESLCLNSGVQTKTVTSRMHTLYPVLCVMIVFVLLFMTSIGLCYKLIHQPVSFSNYVHSFRAWAHDMPFVQHQMEKQFQQTTTYSCGPAAMSYLLQQFGFHYTEAELITRTNANQAEGTSVYNICAVLEEIGLHADAKKVNYPALRMQTFPAIAYITNHFIVIVDTDKYYVTIYDPATGGHYRLSQFEFSHIWDGYVVTAHVKEVTLHNGQII